MINVGSLIQTFREKHHSAHGVTVLVRDNHLLATMLLKIHDVICKYDTKLASAINAKP